MAPPLGTLAGGWLRRAVRAPRRLFQTLQFYEIDGGRSAGRDREGDGATSIAYHEAIATSSSASEYMDACRRLGIEELARERASSGDALLFLTNAVGEIVSFGWRTRRAMFWISEIGFCLRSRGRQIYYDFYTPAEHQRQGFHGLLLKRAFERLAKGETGLIFARSDNEPPLRVYMKLGLRRLSIATMLITGEFALLRRHARGEQREGG